MERDRRVYDWENDMMERTMRMRLSHHVWTSKTDEHRTIQKPNQITKKASTRSCTQFIHLDSTGPSARMRSYIAASHQ